MKERGLRTRWAQQENRRYGKAYEAAQAAWSDTNAELQGMVVTACSYTGMGGGQLAPEVGLRPDETLLWTGAGVTLVETTTSPKLRVPGYDALTTDLLTESFPAEPSARLKPVDSGSVAVTDQRLMFAGTSPRNRRREWVFADLTGLLHTPDVPCTLLQVSANGEKEAVAPAGRHPLTGLLLTPEAVSEFRFVVSLALAEGAGERAAFVAYLERMLDTHQHTRPAPPSLVTAKDSPGRVRLGLRTAKQLALGGAGGSMGGRSLRLVAAAGAAFVLFNVVTPDVPEGQVLSAPPSLADSPSPTASVDLPAPDRILSDPTPAPTTPQPGSQPTAKGRPVPPPPDTKETRAPQPTPTAQPKSSSRSRTPKSTQQNPFPRRDDDGDDDGRGDWMCDAPWNPYQYNFCGGEYVYSPESGVCQYFRCADDFWNEHGYLVECSDGKVTRTGGYRYSCAGHGSYRRTVYQFYSSWSGWREEAHGPDSWGPPAMDSDRDRLQY
ncbi:hypothetical protein [Flindersiella endophytica]